MNIQQKLLVCWVIAGLIAGTIAISALGWQSAYAACLTRFNSAICLGAADRASWLF